MKKDPYYTYTDYWPCKPDPATYKWMTVLLVVLFGLVLGCALYGAELVSLLDGGL